MKKRHLTKSGKVRLHGKIMAWMKKRAKLKKSMSPPTQEDNNGVV